MIEFSKLVLTEPSVCFCSTQSASQNAHKRDKMNDECSTVDDTISSQTSDRKTPNKHRHDKMSSSSFSSSLNAFKMMEANNQRKSDNKLENKPENKRKVNGLQKGSLLDNSIDSILSFEPSILKSGHSDESAENEPSNGRNHILHILVVGFHHKKGCQIDYCYPPTADQLDDEQSSPTAKLPNIWKTLPSIALPDGSHNYDRDTIYFHLPHPKHTHKTIFGISCYRQISAEQLKEKDEDVTRGTVQKSVVVLSELPLYGE